MVVLFIDGRLTILTVIVEIIEKLNNTATSEIKREMHAVFKTIQLYARYHENMKFIVL